MEHQERVGMERVENHDGTVTVTIAFGIDPAVSVEMAKAIPKGETREDQSDKELAYAEHDSSEGEGGEQQEAQDEDPETVSSDGSSGQTECSVQVMHGNQSQQDGQGEQSKNKQKARRADTPLENCRARDPMYCPYHGTKAMTKSLQDKFREHGIEGKVEVSGSGGRFKVSFTVAAQDEPSALAVIDNGLMTKKGVKKTANVGYETQNDGIESKFEAEGKVERDYLANPNEMIGEWVDNIVEKLATDPELKKEVSRNDFITMLGKVGEMNKAYKAVEDNPNDDNLKAAAEAAYQSASDAIGIITAMMDYKGVKTMDDANAISDEYAKTIDEAKAKYAPIDKKVKDKKVELFGQRGAFPPGFAKDNPWAGVRLTPSLSEFSTTGKILTDAAAGMKAAYGAIAGSGKSGADELDYASRRSVRCALQKLASAADMVVGHAANNEAKSLELIEKLDAWHRLNPNGIQKPQKTRTTRKRAASNGGQASQTAQNSNNTASTISGATADQTQHGNIQQEAA